MIREPLALLVLLLATILAALELCRRFRWADRFSSVMWMLFLAAALSNTGVLPTEAPLYEDLIGYTVPFAVCLLLLRVRLADVREAGVPMLAAFVLASIGTALGVMVAGVLLHPWLGQIAGADAWKLAGPYTGTYIGGSLNFFALWEGLEIGRRDLLAAANAVDNLTLFPLLALWAFLPSLLEGRVRVAERWRPTTSAAASQPTHQEPRLVVSHLVALSLIALLIMTIGGWLKELVAPWAPSLPSILIVTTLALAVGQVPAIRRLQGSWELGNLAFYLFFAAVGAMIDVYRAVALAPVLFVYVLIIIVAHMLTVYGVGSAMRMDTGVLTMASAATKAGPAVVLALAEQRDDWEHLALPGVLVGLLGYAVGNYAGFGVAYLMSLLS